MRKPEQGNIRVITLVIPDNCSSDESSYLRKTKYIVYYRILYTDKYRFPENFLNIGLTSMIIMFKQRIDGSLNNLPDKIRTVTEFPVRLSNKEIEVIRSVIKESDPSARIFLFGSRTDITKKGGDIDILILSSALVGRDKRDIRMNLCSLLEDQKIDIIIAKEISTPFVKMALKGGIEL